MLTRLQQTAREGTITITHAYLGHIKRDEDRKALANADALPWEDVDPSLRAILQQHLFQAIEGTMGDVNFPCMYSGDLLSVEKAASSEFDRLKNRPSVEALEAIWEMDEVKPEALMELGNVLAYKVMAAGAIHNHLVAVLKFSMVPSLGAEPVLFTFATIIDLEDREESLLDELSGQLSTQLLANVIKRRNVSRAVLFPCLDADGWETADMLIYATSSAGPWFKALEANRRLSPRREGQSLLRMIAEQVTLSEVPYSLFRSMGDDLFCEAEEGLRCEAVITSLEQAVGHGVDRLGFQARWESTFGDLGYRPSYNALFGGDDVEKPTKLKMEAGEITITMTPPHLDRFRQVTVGDQTFIMFAVDERAKVVVGKDLDMKIRPVDLDGVRSWMTGEG